MSPLSDIQDFDITGDKLTTPLPLGPSGILHGKLENGLTYYVRSCNKPKARAALQLVIRVGSLVEEEHERGIAHILEHLAFNASEAYSNHQVVAVLESLGSAFGPCQNACTSVEETSYELVVPTDKPEIMEQALSVFREFGFKVRCSATDLDKERGPVMEEWRAGRDANGRAQEAHWQLMLAGSRYAERLPIGLESVIKNVDAATVRTFFEKWYHPKHMAVVVVGDLKDPESIVAALHKHLGSEGMDGDRQYREIPHFPWTPHEELRCRTFADKESQQTTVFINYKCDARPLMTPADYLEHLKHELFHSVMNNRLFKVCRREDAAVYSAAFATESIVSVCSVHHLSIIPVNDCVLDAIEVTLLEVARVRQYGVSERELDIAKAEYLAEIEAMYLERDQGYANDIAGEYVRHFLKGELVVGEETEARLSKTLVNLVTTDDLQEISRQLRSTSSCVIKVVQYPARTTEAEVREAVHRVDEMEASGKVEPWTQEDVPDGVLETIPEPGSIASERHYPVLDATELTLSNGMRVCYKVFKALEDQVLMTGFAAGGLSEVSKEDFRTAGLSAMLAGELGIFGFKPHVMGDILAGKRVELKPAEGPYWRSLIGEQSPQDLETCMQLIYKLFTHKVNAVESELKNVLQMARKLVEVSVRNPAQKYANHVRYVNYGRSYYFTPMCMADFEGLDVHKACSHFSQAYQNPAEFTLCFTGNIDVEKFKQLVEQYLASIPALGEPAPLDPANLSMIPFEFPHKPVIESVKVDMIEPVAQVQITFPVQVDRARAAEEAMWVALCCKLLEQRLLRKMRFESGEVYTCAVTASFGCEAPSCKGPIRGDIAINFSCDPKSGARLSHMAMAEVDLLQKDGPDKDEVATVLNLEQRSHENEIQENNYWLEVLVQAYQSRRYQNVRDLDNVFATREAARDAMRAEASPETFRSALRRLLPYPCQNRYTVITMMPSTPILQRLVMNSALLMRSRVAQGFAVAGVVVVAALVMLRAWTRLR